MTYELVNLIVSQCLPLSCVKIKYKMPSAITVQSTDGVRLSKRKRVRIHFGMNIDLFRPARSDFQKSIFKINTDLSLRTNLRQHPGSFFAQLLLRQQFQRNVRHFKSRKDHTVIPDMQATAGSAQNRIVPCEWVVVAINNKLVYAALCFRHIHRQLSRNIERAADAEFSQLLASILIDGVPKCFVQVKALQVQCKANSRPVWVDSL